MLTINIEGMYSVIFYIIVYNIMSSGLWILLLSFRSRSNKVKLKEIGEIILLFNSNKYISIIFFIFLFSSMGIPPMIGFFSKLFILLNIIELKMYFFALFLIIFSSIGVIYYLRLIKMMYASIQNKFLFLVDLGDLNIFFFCYPSYLLILIHNILLFVFI